MSSYNSNLNCQSFDLNGMKNDGAGAFYWNVPVKGSSATLIAEYISYKTGSPMPTVRLFGSLTAPSIPSGNGTPIRNSYGSAQIDVKASSHTTITKTQVSLKNIANKLYIGLASDRKINNENYSGWIYVRTLQISFF